MVTALTLVFGAGLFESAAGMLVAAGTLVFVLMLVAIGGVAYRSFRGDGIEWPEDRDPEAEEGVSEGNRDDEWDYY